MTDTLADRMTTEFAEQRRPTVAEVMDALGTTDPAEFTRLYAEGALSDAFVEVLRDADLLDAPVLP